MDVRQISRIINKFESRYTLTKEKPPGQTRTVVVDKTIERVIGPFFFEDTEGKSDTVKTANYLEMIKKMVIPALKRRNRYTTCVFQQ